MDALLADAGNQLGALPLVAFALSELWPDRCCKEPDLTLAAYDRIGRLGGAIGRRAAALDLDDAQLNRLFPALVQISADGIATRRPLDRSTLPDAEVQELIDIVVGGTVPAPRQRSLPAHGGAGARGPARRLAGAARTGSVSAARICEPAASSTMPWRAG